MTDSHKCEAWKSETSKDDPSLSEDGRTIINDDETVKTVTTALAIPSSLGKLPPLTSCRIRVETDLRAPPKNWLTLGHCAAAGGSGVSRDERETINVNRFSGFDATRHYTGFSSFRMASLFLENGGIQDAEGLAGVDVVSDAENIKQLLRLPFNRKGVLSMVVHRVGKTILLDDLDVMRLTRMAAGIEWKWLQDFFFTVVLQSIESKDKVLVRGKAAKSNAIQERNLISKFLYRSIENPTKDVATAHTPWINESQDSSAETSEIVCKIPPPPGLRPDDIGMQDPKLSSTSRSHEFARTLLWNFEDIRMLIGSDMPIFGDAEHPCVSLRLHSTQKPINVLTGLDYWLDNLMCQVPEVLMCFHINGIVQKYELIKTEDLPKLSEDCQFKPHVIRDVAQNILSFLKSNATKEGHTYWLFKAKDDEVVKLYDLTSICGEYNFSPTPEPGEKTVENPFKTAVAMLLYKVARNMLSSDTRNAKLGTAQKLLEKCLSLLDKKKYPQLATSIHFMLSDIYFPDDIDPSDPKIHKTEEEEEEKASEPEKETASTHVQKMEVESLMDPFSGPWVDDIFSEPLQVPKNVFQRCREGLSHVVEGLEFLKKCDEEKKEADQRQRRERENFERDNLKMSGPNEPIPMKDETTPKKEPDSPVKKELGKTHSWIRHLETVLIRKAVIIYIVLAENYFLSGKHGGVLRLLKRGINCYELVCKLQGTHSNLMPAGSNTMIISFAFGVAADSYISMLKNWPNIVAYQEQFKTCDTDVDLAISDIVERHVDEECRDWLVRIPKDIEDCVNRSWHCFNRAISLCFAKSHAEEMASLKRRRGNCNNEAGVFYLNQSIRLTNSLEKGEVGCNVLNSIMNTFNKSLIHFKQGASDFKEVKDYQNSALLLSNAGKLLRSAPMIYEHFYQHDCGVMAEMIPKGRTPFDIQKERFQSAIDYFVQAFDVLGHRKHHPYLHDQFTWELCKTHFAFGRMLQDSFSHQTTDSATLEREITEQYQKAISLCEPDKVQEGKEQARRSATLATIHYRLASLLHIRIKEVDDEVKKRSLRQLAEKHYGRCLTIFLNLGMHYRALRVQLERVCLIEPNDVQSRVAKKALVAVFEIYCDLIPLLKRIKEFLEQHPPEHLGPDEDEEEEPDIGILSESQFDWEEETEQVVEIFNFFSLWRILKKRLGENLKLAIMSISQKRGKKSSSEDPAVKFVKSVYLESIRLDEKEITFPDDVLKVISKMKANMNMLK